MAMVPQLLKAHADNPLEAKARHLFLFTHLISLSSQPPACKRIFTHKNEAFLIQRSLKDSKSTMAFCITQKALKKLVTPLIFLLCGTLVYYHCTVLKTSLVSLVCDVLVVLLCSLAVLGMMFRHLNVLTPVDPMDWQVSQETVSGVAEFVANTIGAAESVFRVAARGHDKKLFCKVLLVLYVLSIVGRAISGATVVYAALCLASVIFLASKCLSNASCLPPFFSRRNFNRVEEEES